MTLKEEVEQILKRQFLWEMPIIDVDYKDLRGEKSEESSFWNKIRSIRKIEWRNDLIGSWKDPRKFRIVFADVGEAYAPGGGDPEINPVTKGWKHYGGKPLNDHMYAELKKVGITPTKGVITLIVFGIDDRRFKLTPWSLGHRFGHAVESLIISNPNIKKALDIIPMMDDRYGRPDTRRTDKLQLLIQFVSPYGGCSFYSARTNNFTGDTEVFAELTAQKLIRGKSHFNLLEVVPGVKQHGYQVYKIAAIGEKPRLDTAEFHKSIDDDNDFDEIYAATKYVTECNKKNALITKHFNAGFDEVFKSCIGKIVAV